MADVLTLRAEIKAWERQYKDENGIPPTVDDIRQNPPIAEKYKQYKRLSKLAASASSSKAQQDFITPSTPPRATRPKQPTSVLLSRSRGIQPSAPLSSFNPFSPQKKQKGKERETTESRISQEARLKPLTKTQPGHRPKQVDPVVSLGQSSSFLATSSTSRLQFNLTAEPTNAVSRARKRLRGEPVSPSPNKDKRRRILSHTSLPFPRLGRDSPSSEEEDEDAAQLEGDSSFVDNSPVKSTNTGKLFPALFEEKLIPIDLFGGQSTLGLSNYSAASQKPNASADGRHKVSKRVPSSKTLFHSAVGAGGSQPAPTTSASKILGNPSNKASQSTTPELDTGRPSTKRSLSDNEDDTLRHHAPAKSPLLPPSPPPSTSITSYNEAGRKKAKAKAAMNKSRKKAKIDEGMSPSNDSDEEDNTTKLRLVARNSTRHHHAGPKHDEDDEGISDVDAVLAYTRFTGPRGTSPADTRKEDGNIDIDLPDKLRDILALNSAKSKAQSSQEDSLVQGLLYGRRVTNYNGQKGGEIWDVGEDEHGDVEADRYTEGEDDWEGEPVPWESAEL